MTPPRQVRHRSVGDDPPARAGRGQRPGEVQRRLLARRLGAPGAAVVLVLAGAVGCGTTRAAHAQTAPSLATAQSSTAAATAPTPSVSVRATATTYPAALGSGSVGGPAQIPWPSVGPGWYLVFRSAGRSSEQLALYDPQGGAYVISSWPSSSTAGPTLQAWSPDGRSAVVSSGPVAMGARAGAGEVDLVDLATGSRSVVAGLRSDASVAFTEPHGDELLVGIPDASGASDNGTLDQTIERTTLSGTVTAVLATHAGGALDAPDGTEVVLAGSSYRSDLQVVSNAGGVPRSLPDTGTCSPERFWNGDQLLARCTPPDSGVTYLVLIDVHTGAITRLTPAHPANSSDGGDLNAFLLDGTLYSTAAGACGVLTVDRLSPDGSVTQIPVAHQGDVTQLVGTVGHLLVVEAGPTAGAEGCSVAPLLETVDPVTDVSHTIIPSFVDGELLTYPEPAEA